MPLILGMDFLVKTSPSIDWKKGKVTCQVGTKFFNLPTCSISSFSEKSDDNTFAGLPIEEV